MSSLPPSGREPLRTNAACAAHGSAFQIIDYASGHSAGGGGVANGGGGFLPRPPFQRTRPGGAPGPHWNPPVQCSVDKRFPLGRGPTRSREDPDRTTSVGSQYQRRGRQGRSGSSCRLRPSLRSACSSWRPFHRGRRRSRCAGHFGLLHCAPRPGSQTPAPRRRPGELVTLPHA
jgi:hypothetical protein